MITLARTDFIFKASNLSLQVSNDFLKNLEVSLTCLVILDLFTVSVNNTVSGIVRGGSSSGRCLKSAVSQAHSVEFAIDFFSRPRSKLVAADRSLLILCPLVVLPLR